MERKKIPVSEREVIFEFADSASGITEEQAMNSIAHGVAEFMKTLFEDPEFIKTLDFEEENE